MCSTNTGITRYTTTQDHNTFFNFRKEKSEQHIPINPVDAEAVSVTSQTTERVRCTLDKGSH